MSDLRKKLIRLAHRKPHLRPHLIPLLRVARTRAKDMDYDEATNDLARKLIFAKSFLGDGTLAGDWSMKPDDNPKRIVIDLFTSIDLTTREVEGRFINGDGNWGGTKFYPALAAAVDKIRVTKAKKVPGYVAIGRQRAPATQLFKIVVSLTPPKKKKHWSDTL